MSSKINLIEHDSVEKALAEAVSQSIAMAGSTHIPCTIFKQGERTMISTALPFLFLADSTKVRMHSATKGSNPAQAHNRPKIPDHVKSIHHYMLNNPDDYFLPPVTLNVAEATVHVVRGWSGAPSLAFLVIYSNTRFSVTDGQHRLTAITGQDGKAGVPRIFDVNERFENDSMAVLIVVEGDLERIHQDFADAAQTKAIPASMLAVYNMREPMNRVLNDIVKGTPVFHERVDMTSTALPKKSQKAFLLNQVRQMVKAILFGDAALGEDQVSARGVEVIGTAAKQENEIRKALVLTDALCRHMGPWTTIVTFPVSGDAANQIPELREQYLNLTGSGLQVIGRVAHDINKTVTDPAERERLYQALATEIDWRRSAGIWQGNVILAEGKVATNRGPVNIAVEKVKRALGLDYNAKVLEKAEAPAEIPGQAVGGVATGEAFSSPV
ncbi:DNA sulfur modification protein DndB [Streptomyces sp. NPDC002734]|uniref:DNA sulfur modification protein DndB n=1 Tax=Streptomyces sp. NPDC002734 TaxID=3154426 RepID=UPI00332ED978